jgi:hypothetical protein
MSSAAKLGIYEKRPEQIASQTHGYPTIWVLPRAHFIIFKPLGLLHGLVQCSKENLTNTMTEADRTPEFAHAQLA